MAVLIGSSPLGSATAQDMAKVISDVSKRMIVEHFKKEMGVESKAVTGKKEEEDEDSESKAKKTGKKDKKAGKKDKKAKKDKKGKKKGLPPGLAKKKQLPPGLQRQYEKNDKLPPGLAKRDLPEDLTSKLPPPPAGTQRVVVDNDVVLIEQATGKVLDILFDAVLGGRK
ncbi:MAG: hypothetical protein HOL85_19690 [Rhodospirillaceae bacterium]|nr:hypothetical protein [Rhodospirillaceae bacterium]